jgi:hypothetical protein
MTFAQYMEIYETERKLNNKDSKELATHLAGLLRDLEEGYIAPKAHDEEIAGLFHQYNVAQQVSKNEWILIQDEAKVIYNRMMQGL